MLELLKRIGQKKKFIAEYDRKIESQANTIRNIKKKITESGVDNYCKETRLPYFQAQLQLSINTMLKLDRQRKVLITELDYLDNIYKKEIKK